LAHHVIPLRRERWSLSGHNGHRSNVPINLDLWYAPRSVYPDGQIAHARHAKIARRVTLPQAVVVAPSGKSGPLIPPSRAHKEGASRSSRNVVRDAMDAAASNDE
jgi:hypothetical protein